MSPIFDNPKSVNLICPSEVINKLQSDENKIKIAKFVCPFG